MGGLLMKRMSNLNRLVYNDSREAMVPAVILYSINSILCGGLTIYTASILGQFADAVLRRDGR